MPLALAFTSKPTIAGYTCRDIDMAVELTIAPFQTWRVIPGDESVAARRARTKDER
jgi:hypothetical protein